MKLVLLRISPFSVIINFSHKTSCKMGSEQSNLIPMPDGFDFMTVTFKGSDQLRLTYPTEQDINTTREVIMEYWPKGISFTAFVINKEQISIAFIYCI